MPNEYVNKVELADGTTLIDITDTSAQVEDVLPGKIFYAANGARSVGNADLQSDWEEDDSTELAYIKNRPAIRAGEGENSIVEGQIEQNEQATIYTIYVSGSGTSLTYATEDTLPSATSLKNYGVFKTDDGNFSAIKNIDTTNNTIEIYALAYPSDTQNREAKIYYYYKEAFGKESKAEGRTTIAAGAYSHAEGQTTQALRTDSHAEGCQTKAIAMYAHAEGYYTLVQGTGAMGGHAEGRNTEVTGSYSHAEGYYTIANHASQHVLGRYNIADPSTASATNKGDYVEIVGNGTANTARSNARTLDWDGNEVLAGKLTVGVGPTNDMDVATKQYVDNNSGGGVVYGTVTINNSNVTFSSTITPKAVYDNYQDMTFVVKDTYKEDLYILTNISYDDDDEDCQAIFVNTNADEIIQIKTTWQSPTSTAAWTGTVTRQSIIKTLSALTDTNFTSTISNGDILRYDSTARQWKNEAEVLYSSITITGTSVAFNGAINPQNVTSVYRNKPIIIYDEDSGDVYTLKNYASESGQCRLIFVAIVDSTIKTITTNWKSVDIGYEGFTGTLTTQPIISVDITTPTDGQLLKYNATSGKWENVAPVTYSLSISNNVITLTGSDGSTSSITLPVYNGGVSS